MTSVTVAFVRRGGIAAAAALSSHQLLEVRMCRQGSADIADELARRYGAERLVCESKSGPSPLAQAPARCTPLAEASVREHFACRARAAIYGKVLSHYPQLQRLVPLRADGCAATTSRRRTLTLFAVALGMTELGITPIPHDETHQR